MMRIEILSSLPTRSLFAAVVLASATGQAQAQQLWAKQLGAVLWNNLDEARAIASDSAGGAVIGGYTRGHLAMTSLGQYDAWLARYNASGTRTWLTQFGTGMSDYVDGLATDGVGGVFAVGWIGRGGGLPHAEGIDAYVARFDEVGDQVWLRVLRTGPMTFAKAVTADGSGGAFIAGYGYDLTSQSQGFVTHVTNAGTTTWFTEFGGSGYEHARAIALDGSGGIYVAGTTNSNYGGENAGKSDAFIARFDSSGNQIWVRQFGTVESEKAHGLAPDGFGGVYITGETEGDLFFQNNGSTDCFIVRYDSQGNQTWSGQFGTDDWDQAYALAADGNGGVTVTGETWGDMAGSNIGYSDVFRMHFDAGGRLLYAQQFGTGNEDEGHAMIAVDLYGVTIAGSTRGSLGGSSAGAYDGFIAKFSDGCNADCDRSTGVGTLDVFDFLCFQNAFVSSMSYACDCDTSMGIGVCDVFDFLCFQNAFVGGCP